MNIFTYKEIKSINNLHQTFKTDYLRKERKNTFPIFLKKFDCKYNLYLIVNMIFPYFPIFKCLNYIYLFSQDLLSNYYQNECMKYIV